MSETVEYQPDLIGALPLAGGVNAVVGVTPTLLTRPNTAKFLVLMTDRCGFRIRRGNFVSSGMPADEMPAASITDGTGGIYVREGGSVVLSANVPLFTAKGYTAGSVLSYFFI